MGGPCTANGTGSVNYTPYSFPDQTRLNALYFLETFPGGSEWAQYIPGCPVVQEGVLPYLYYRLHDTPGKVELMPAGGTPGTDTHAVTMQIYPDSTYRVRGCNDVPGMIAFAEIHRVRNLAECWPVWLPDATCIPQPPDFGLHLFHTRWENPHYGLPPGPPAYGMPYDATQHQISATYPMLAGAMPADYDRDRHRLLGAIQGAGTGSLRITHSARPGTVTVPVVGGAFYGEVPTCETFPGDGACWVRPFASWPSAHVTVPGTLTFDFQGDDGSTLTEQRTIVFGNGGRHEFLLGPATSAGPLAAR